MLSLLPQAQIVYGHNSTYVIVCACSVYVRSEFKRLRNLVAQPVGIQKKGPDRSSRGVELTDVRRSWPRTPRLAVCPSWKGALPGGGAVRPSRSQQSVVCGCA